MVVSAAFTLGKVLKMRAKLAEAETLFRRSLATVRRYCGDDAQWFLRSQGPALMRNLGQVLLAQGRAGEAEVILRENAELHQRHCEPDDPRLARAESELGNALVALGRYEEAEPLLLRSFDVLRDLRGTKNFHTKLTRSRLVRLYEKWGKPDQAAQLRARSTATSAPASTEVPQETRSP